MIPIKAIIYKISLRKNIIDLVFTTPLFSKSFIHCKIVKKFDYNSDY